MSLAKETAHVKLDLRGKVCPYPTGETMKALEAMEWGQLLEVLSDYYPAKTTIPFLCWQQSYPWELREEEGGLFRILVKKEKGESKPPPEMA